MCKIQLINYCRFARRQHRRRCGRGSFHQVQCRLPAEHFRKRVDLAIEIYSIRYGCDDQMLERLLNTLAASLTPRLVSQEERNGILPLKSFGLSSLREDLCCLLFDTYSSALAYAKQAQYIVRGVLLPVLESGLNDEAIRDSSLGTIRSLCSNCGSALLPIISRIIIMLISKLDKPNSALFETLAHICRLYGPGSTLFRHFYVIFGAMRHPLDEQEYGESAASVLAAIVETSSFLVKPEVLMSVQRKICEEIIKNPSSPSYCRILIAFLSCTHEVVPPPVHVARTVLGRCVDPLQSQHLRALCDTISRPRIQNLASHEVIRRCDVEMQESSDHLEKEQSSKSMGIGNEESVPLHEHIEEVKQSSIVCEELMDDTVVEIQKTMIEAGTEKSVVLEEEDKAHKEMKQQMVTVPDIKISNPSSTASDLPSSSNASTTVNSASRVESTSTEEPVLKKAKFMKKKKKSVENTMLAEGEASVEEILSTFCPE
ncbi:unnamed protein product [Cylicocyclus nassatus]|uniref:Uncharacterized protein n=1 Tax=Cylicocyclus nassatus TaxID=53992 RepID=A0AA36DU31_CYLNA|nr:unnamed protein product [Cylicocyclus nassatus]